MECSDSSCDCGPGVAKPPGASVLLAAGHNKKVPLLLICTAFTMLKGMTHNKVWKVNEADGSVSQHQIKTPQPECHALYRLWMNVVDLHNKLRQGVVAMADVWLTTDWAKRHFAEGLGFWAVNVFKALIYVYPQYRHISLGEFRARLAWALMTLGKVPYPPDVETGSVGGSSSSTFNSTPGTLPSAPLPGTNHTWHGTEKSKKQCSYCPFKYYNSCTACEQSGAGLFSACGSKTNRDCMKKHVMGDPPTHGNWYMSSPGKRNVAAAMAAVKRRKAGVGDEVSSLDSDDT